MLETVGRRLECKCTLTRDWSDKPRWNFVRTLARHRTSSFRGCLRDGATCITYRYLVRELLRHTVYIATSARLPGYLRTIFQSLTARLPGYLRTIFQSLTVIWSCRRSSMGQNWADDTLFLFPKMTLNYFDTIFLKTGYKGAFFVAVTTGKADRSFPVSTFAKFSSFSTEERASIHQRLR